MKRQRPSERWTSVPQRKPVKPHIVRQNAIVAQAVHQMAAAEEHKDISVFSTTNVVFAQTTAVSNLINPCAQGVTTVTRSGRRTTMTSLSYMFTCRMAPTTTGAGSLRLLIVYDRQPNGAAPATTDVVLADTITSGMNLNNSRRFKILVDEIYDGISTVGPASFFSKGYRSFAKKKEGGWPCEFKNTSAGDITDITTGSIYSFVWQDGGLLIASPANNLFTRIRFTDA